jgi:hypothetical protein
MLRRALTTAVLATGLVAACGEAASTPGTTSKPATTAPPTTIAAEPYGLDDLAGAYTVPAAIEHRILSGENPGYFGDLLLDEFACDAIRAALAYELVACAEGGTAESQFIVVVGDEFVERDAATDITTISLQYAVYRSVSTPAGDGARAEVVMSATERREVSVVEMVTLTLERVDTAAGRAIAVHHTVIGGSRAQNTIEMIGLNRYGSPQVVATHQGEGVAEFTDGEGLVYSGYHYAADEAMCCPSYVAAHYFRPGPNGWTHSRLTAPNDPDKQMAEESLFAGLRAVETVATYEYAISAND